MQIRAARPDDYDAFTRFWDQLDLDQALPPRERWIELMCPHTIFLVEGETLAAYNLSFAFGARGDVRQVVVDRAFRGRGVGKQLMAEIATRLRAAGCREWRLEVRTENAPAIALYRSAGMQPLHTIEVLEIDRDACGHFAASRSHRHAVQPVALADDAELESVLDLGQGQIERWRRVRAGSPLVRVGMTALTQIWRDFSPAHGLLFPFYAPDADVAAHLVAEALPGPYELCVIDPAISAALVAVGGRVKERQVVYGGRL